MCGIIYVHSNKELDDKLIYGLERLIKHRGQDNTGVCSVIDDYFHITKGKSLPLTGFPVKKQLALGVRYATIGADESFNYTPSVFIKDYNDVSLNLVTNKKESLVVFLNGESITNWVDETLNYNFNSTNDTSRLTALIHYLSIKEPLIDSVKKVLSVVPGAYSLIVMKGDDVIIARGKHGIRPLEFFQSNGFTVISSETQVFDLFDKRYNLKLNNFRSINPGELLHFNNGELNYHSIKSESLHQCIFELIYFAHPAGYLFDAHIPVMKFRGRLGRKFKDVKSVIKTPDEDLIVSPVPNSGRSAADGNATFYNHKKRECLIPGIKDRTFISPGQDLRDFLASIKYIPASYVFLRGEDLERSMYLGNSLIDSLKQYGNEIVFIDDSLVRGTTAPHIIANALLKGAKKVHLKLTAPELRFNCFYGIAMKGDEDFFARNKNSDEILNELLIKTNKIIADSLIKAGDDPSIVKADNDNVNLEFMTLDNLVRVANSFYVEKLLRQKLPELSNHFNKEFAYYLLERIPYDCLINQQGLTVKDEIFNQLPSDFKEVINESLFNELFNEAVKQRWCLACFNGHYPTKQSCSDCAERLNIKDSVK